MKLGHWASVVLFSVLATVGMVSLAIGEANPASVVTGRAAFVASNEVTAGVFRKITTADLPKPFDTDSASTQSKIVPRPAGSLPTAPVGIPRRAFCRWPERTACYAPRTEWRHLPHRDANRSGARLSGHDADGKPKENAVFATGLHEPYGMIFYPSKNPQWLYVANTDSVVRYAYKAGDMKATGKAETVIASLPSSRPQDEVAWQAYDAAIAKRAKRLPITATGPAIWRSRWMASGFLWQSVLPPIWTIRTITPPRSNAPIFSNTRRRASSSKSMPRGIRNPSGIAVNPVTGQLWCSVNERDGLGNDLAPDYITHVEEGGFYGWPYYYLGGNPDPRLKGKHPELKDKTIVPDVLLQSHSASLQMIFYDGKQFPAEYRGDIFASEHGSWNRKVRSGYELVRVPLKNGKSNGIYEDFLTGFITPTGEVWGRPVGVTVAADGSLLVSDDGSGSIWRVSYSGK